MLKKKNSIVFVVVAILCSIIVLQPKSYAAGSTVSPAFVRFTVSESVKEQTNAVAIKNNSDTTTLYEISIVDVNTATGSLVPQESASELTKSVFKLSESTITLLKDQSKNVIVTANNMANLPPGGMYAALSIKQKSVEGQKNSVNQAVSVGLFLIKEDGATRQINLQSSPVKKVVFTTIKKEEIKITNSGNVEVVPQAVINITRGTETYQKALINEASLFIFPAKDKYYEAKYTELKSMPIGRYTKTIAYRYDGQKDQTIVSEYFWYVPISFIINCLVLGTLMLLVVVLKRRKRTKAKPLTMPKQGTTVRTKSSQEPRTTIENMTKNAIRISQPRSTRKKIQDVGAEIKKPKKKKKTSKTKAKTKEKKSPNKSE